MTPPPTDKLRRLAILHFNDVYNADGGAGARFVAAIKKTRAGAGPAEQRLTSSPAPSSPSASSPSPLVLFSGDALFPSTVSTVTMGRHMVPVLNMAGVDCACLGNHDVDGGVANFASMGWSFPWLCSNADDSQTGAPFAGCRRSFVIEHAASGLRVGLLGIVEKDWAATLPCVEEEDIVVKPFVEEARRQARALREEEGVDVVIALTHMRLPNDRILAKEAGKDIDVVLGGHDHDAVYEPGAGEAKEGQPRVAPVIKSGTDFRTLSRIVISVPPRSSSAGNSTSSPSRAAAAAVVAEYELVSVPKDAPEDPECAAAVSEFTAALEARMGDVIGPRTAADLDGRFATVRSRESNLGDLVADVFRRVLRADAALLNSGTFRSDSVHPAGDLTVRDLVTLFPLLDETAVVRVTGSQLLRALENGVSKWPRLEGRFPQVSGIRFAFDARRAPCERVLRESVEVAGAPLEEARTYTLATKAFVSPEGKDGYDCVAGCPAVRDPSSCPVLPVILRSALHALSAVNGMKPPTAGVRAFAAKWRAQAAAAARSGAGGGQQQQQHKQQKQQEQQQQAQQEEVAFARHAMLCEGMVKADPLRGGELVIDARTDGRIKIVGEEEARAAAALEAAG